MPKLPKIYQKLLRIKTPVLISVVPSRKDRKTKSRTRILYPDGRCKFHFDYAFKELTNDDLKAFVPYFNQSCFLDESYYNLCLFKTVQSMYRYDKTKSKGGHTDRKKGSTLKILGIVKL